MWDAEFEPVMKLLLNRKDMKIKSASEVGKKKVDYFRGRDFKRFCLANDTLLQKKCPAALKAALDGKAPANDKDVERLGAELIDRGFIFKAEYKPMNGSKDSGSDKKTKKWPDRLGRDKSQQWDNEGFYALIYEGGSAFQHFLLALIILGVLLICMFPVWPIWGKIGIWYLCVIFLTLYFGVIIVRMIIFTMFWIVGFDFWVFPNLNDEYCGIRESFSPLYSWEKRKDDVMMLFVRFTTLGMTGLAMFHVAETHSLSDFQDFVVGSYSDVIDWGVDKFTALPGSSRQALPNLKDIMADSEEDAAKEAEASGSDDGAARVDESLAEDVPVKAADAEAEDDDADTVDMDAEGKKEL